MLFESEDVFSAIPVGGPRKLSQTSRKRDSSASLQSIRILVILSHSWILNTFTVQYLSSVKGYNYPVNIKSNTESIHSNYI